MTGPCRKAKDDSWRLLAAVMLSVAAHAFFVALPAGETLLPDHEERYFIEIGILDSDDFIPDQTSVRNLASPAPPKTTQTETESPIRSTDVKKAPSTPAKDPPKPALNVASLEEASVSSRPVEKKAQSEPEIREQRSASSDKGARQSAPDLESQDSAAELSATKTGSRARPLSSGNPSPRYPRLALRRGWEGDVVLRVQVNPSGLVEQVQIHSSSGHDLLDDSAVEAVRAWRFEPARRGDRPVTAVVRIPVQFRLQQG